LVTGPATSTSRAFWEMKAEQVMDRVFANALHSYRRHGAEAPASPDAAPAPEAPIELVEVREEPRPAPAWPGAATAAAAGVAAGIPAPPPPPAAAPPRSQGRPQGRAVKSAGAAAGWSVAGLALSPRVVMASLGSVAVMAAGTSLVFWKGWSEASFDLRQERTVRLLENLRGIGSEAGAPAAVAADKAAAAKPGASADGALPPPPPDEPWIQELGQLPGGEGGNQAAVLRVPVSGTLSRPAPPASGGPSGGGGGRSGGAPAAAPSGPVPELVGVVQIPGRSGSAIFQLGGSSTNALVGDQIGSSGWRLQSATGDTAVIEKGGVERRISISSGF